MIPIPSYGTGRSHHWLHQIQVTEYGSGFDASHFPCQAQPLTVAGHPHSDQRTTNDNGLEDPEMPERLVAGSPADDEEQDAGPSQCQRYERQISVARSSEWERRG